MTGIAAARNHAAGQPGSKPAALRTGPSGAHAVTAVMLRDRFRSPAVQGSLAFVLYLLAWVTTGFRPIVANGTQMVLRPASPDPNFSVWSLRWWPYSVGHGLDPLYTHALMPPRPAIPWPGLPRCRRSRCWQRRSP